MGSASRSTNADKDPRIQISPVEVVHGHVPLSLVPFEFFAFPLLATFCTLFPKFQISLWTPLPRPPQPASVFRRVEAVAAKLKLPLLVPGDSLLLAEIVLSCSVRTVRGMALMKQLESARPKVIERGAVHLLALAVLVLLILVVIENQLE